MEELIDIYEEFKSKFELGDISRTIEKQRNQVNELISKAKLGKQITNMELMTILGIPISLLDDPRIYNWIVDGLREDKVPYMIDVK